MVYSSRIIYTRHSGTSGGDRNEDGEQLLPLPHLKCRRGVLFLRTGAGNERLCSATPEFLYSHDGFLVVLNTIVAAWISIAQTSLTPEGGRWLTAENSELR